MIEVSTELLHAFARSDRERIARLCAEELLLVGTDEGEIWQGRSQLLNWFPDFQLDVEWVEQPHVGPDWLFGEALFSDPDGGTTRVRVTMVFRDQLLVHAHYSVAR